MKYSAGPSIMMLVAVVNQVKRTSWNNNLKLIIAIVILLFGSIIRFSNEE